jgi:GAF domain-containing protein
MPMTQTYFDRFQLNLILTVLFIFGIGASLYLIYSLPSSLHLSDGYQPEFLPVYFVTGATFLLGASTLVWALRYKKEVIVFRDKIIDESEQRREAEQAGKTTISLDAVKTALGNEEQKDALNSALQTICKQLSAAQGALYLSKEVGGRRIVELRSGYALNMGESTVLSFEYGEGLVGQVAVSGQTIVIDEVPEGYITILSGLGSASPQFLLLVPVKDQDRTVGVMEIASFSAISEDEKKFVNEAAQLMSARISTTV